MEKLKNIKGFTLAELIVAAGVFMFVAVLAVGVFTGALKNQRVLVDKMAVNSNLGLILEQIAREIRTGYKFSSTSGLCESSITFISGQKNTETSYNLNGDIIERLEFPNSRANLTSNNVSVQSLCFVVVQDPGDGSNKPSRCMPPRITILIKAKPKHIQSSSIPPIFLQTTVSSRVIPKDIKEDPFNCRQYY